jgi:1-acyl-sn-glycerol-3-phosphate acyltransferase
MLYRLFYYLLKLTCYLYFRKIRLYQTENIPTECPLIVCANHGNSFMDAILIAIIFKRKLYFLARSDAFNSSFKRWFLSQINMMPIYRIRDGRDEVKNNDIIFEKCERILENNGAILIFPEGNCIVEKRLRTFKTGFVQLAFESKVNSLHILPITINYSKPLEFFTEVSFTFNNLIAVTDIKKESSKDYIYFSKKLIAAVKEKIEKEMIIIPKNDDDEFYEQVLELTRNNSIEDIDANQLLAINYLNQMRNDNIHLFNDLMVKTKLYFNNLKSCKIEDEAIYTSEFYKKNHLFITYPFYLVGYIIHFLPSRVIECIVNYKIKEKQFTSAVRMVIALFVYLVYLPIIFFSITLLFNFGGIYLIGFIYFHFANFKSILLMQQINKNSHLIENLKSQRANVVKLLNP